MRSTGAEQLLLRRLTHGCCVRAQLVVRAAAAEARQKQPLAKQLEAEIRSEAVRAQPAGRERAAAGAVGEEGGHGARAGRGQPAAAPAVPAPRAVRMLGALHGAMHHRVPWPWKGPAWAALHYVRRLSTLVLESADRHACRQCCNLEFLFNRTEKTRKLRELQEELCTLDADITQVRTCSSQHACAGSAMLGMPLVRKAVQEAAQAISRIESMCRDQY